MTKLCKQGHVMDPALRGCQECSRIRAQDFRRRHPSYERDKARERKATAQPFLEQP